jgi:hypothetical protein
MTQNQKKIFENIIKENKNFKLYIINYSMNFNLINFLNFHKILLKLKIKNIYYLVK